MSRCLLIALKVAAWVLVAAVWLWFAPIALSMLADGSYDRQKRRERNNEYWYRRHGLNQWIRHFERTQHKKRKKQWKKRNNFYKETKPQKALKKIFRVIRG